MSDGPDGERALPERIAPDWGPDWDAEDPETAAIQWSLEEGLVWADDQGWLVPEDAREQGYLIVNQRAVSIGPEGGRVGERLAAFTEKTTARLSARDRTWVKLKTLARDAGYRRITDDVRLLLSEAMKSRGIYHYPLDLRECRPDDTVQLSTEPFRDRGLQFVDENEICDFIMRHYRRLEPFLKCTRVKRNPPLSLHTRVVQPDLYFSEPGGIVVVEVEKSSGRFESGSQIAAYVRAGAADDKAKGKRVRGVVITNEPNPDQEEEVRQFSAREGYQVDWYYYRLAFDLEPVGLTSPPAE